MRKHHASLFRLTGMSTPLQTDRFPDLAYTLARLQCVCERVFAADEEYLRLFVHLRVGAFVSRQAAGINEETLWTHGPLSGPRTTDAALHDWTAMLLAISRQNRTCTIYHNPPTVEGPGAEDVLGRAISLGRAGQNTHPDHLPAAYLALHEALHGLNWLKYPLLHPPQPSTDYADALRVQGILLLNVLDRWQDLLARDRARIAALDRAARSLGTIHHHLVRYPLTSAARTAEATGLTSATSLRGLQQLTIMGITEETTGARRNRQYRYRAAIDLLSEAGG